MAGTTYLEGIKIMVSCKQASKSIPRHTMNVTRRIQRPVHAY